MGPISYLIVEFPGNKMTGEGFPLLVDLVDRRDHSHPRPHVRDPRRGRHRCTPSTSRTSTTTASSTSTVFEGASSGLLDDSDLADAAPAIEPGSSAGILIFENRWATEFTQALGRGGAELVAAGYIPQDDVAASLDATDH